MKNIWHEQPTDKKQHFIVQSYLYCVQAKTHVTQAKMWTLGEVRGKEEVAYWVRNGKKGCEKEEREEVEVVLRTHKFGGTRETKELTRDRLT